MSAAQRPDAPDRDDREDAGNDIVDHQAAGGPAASAPGGSRPVTTGSAGAPGISTVEPDGTWTEPDAGPVTLPPVVIAVEQQRHLNTMQMRLLKGVGVLITS